MEQPSKEECRAAGRLMREEAERLDKRKRDLEVMGMGMSSGEEPDAMAQNTMLDALEKLKNNNFSLCGI